MLFLVVSFLTVTFFGGLGYQLRRWTGKSPWWVGVAFVIFLLPAGVVGTTLVIALFATPTWTTARLVAYPVFSGLLIGAGFICMSDDLLPEFSGESAHDRKEVNGPRPSVHSQESRWKVPTRTHIVMALTGFFLAGVLVVTLSTGDTEVASAVERPEEKKPELETREVKVDLSGVPSTATIRVPASFTSAESAYKRVKEQLILAAKRENEARQSVHSKVLARDWTKEVSQLTTLSVGQLGSVKDHQGTISPEQWKRVLEYGRGDPSSKFQERIDSMQSRMEEGSNAADLELSTPIATVRNGSLIAYKTVEAEVGGQTVRWLTARKSMYDSGYSVVTDIAVNTRSGLPVDSLQTYVRAITFSAE